MNIKPYIIVSGLLLGLGGGTAPSFAQLNENVAVEGRYEPIVIETERINIYPSAVKFELPTVNLSEEMKGIVTDFQPTLLTMGFTGWRTNRTPSKQKGYLDMNLGSWLNSNLSAGYRALADSVNTLDLALQFKSTSLSKRGRLPEGIEAMSKRYLYDGTFSLGWKHNLRGSRYLSADLDYRLARFDYYGSTLPANSPFIEHGAPAQTLNSLSFNLGINRTPNLPRGWHAGAGLRYFGYNSLFPMNYLTSPHISGGRETQLEIDGGYIIPLKGGSRLALNGNLDVVFYTGKENLPQPFHKLPSYAMLTLRPAYLYSRPGFDFRLGAVVDMTFNAEGETLDSKYSLFHFAPDVRMHVTRDKFGFRLGVTGGSELMTLSRKEQWDYYQMPYLVTTQPSYTPLDAEAGFSFGPFAGFTADISAGYDVTLHTPVGGWYQVMLGGYAYGVDALTAQGTPLFDFSRKGLDLHGAKVKLMLAYTGNDIFDASFQLTYTPQNNKKGVFNGYDRSRWVMDVSAGIRPVKKLKIALGYSYRGVRTIYTYLTPAAGGDDTLCGLRLPDLTDLKASLTYSITDNLHIYCRAANLLNRKVDYLPGLTTQGITFCGGFDLIF